MYAAVIVVTVWLVIWLLGSARLLLPSSRETVIVSFDVDVEGQRAFNRICDSLRRAFKAIPLSQPIRLVFTGPGVVEDIASASKFIERQSATVVVWGKSEFGQINGEKVLIFEVNHTFAMREALSKNFEQLKADIALLYPGGDWKIKEVNDLVDTKAVADGLLEIALALIGIDLYLRGRTKDGVQVFQTVVEKALHRARNSDNEVVKRYRDILHGGIIREGILAHQRGDQMTAIELLLPLLPKHSESIPLLLTLARAYYYVGNEKNAVHYTMEIGRIDRAHPAVPASRAFFSIRKRNYEEVKRWYDRLLSAKRVDKYDLLPSISTFLDERYEEEPNEHAFLYGLAIVNGIQDPLILKSDMQEFLSRTESQEEYAPLRKRAGELVRVGG